MTRFVIAAALVLALSAAPSAQTTPDWAAPTPYESAPLALPDEALALLVPCPPGQTDDGMGGCITNPPTQVPIDGGLSLLALAGAGLAARRLRAAR